MHRPATTIALAVAALTLAGCASSTTTASPARSVAADSPTPAAAKTTTVGHPRKKNALKKSESGCSLKLKGDIIVRMVVPGVETSAQVLGGVDFANCQPTFDLLRATSPTEPGNCTEAAYASDNPGYDADATPAARLKKVVLAIGPACGNS